MKTKKLLSILTLCTVLCTGVGFETFASSRKELKNVDLENELLENSLDVDKIVESMSVEEKIGQMLMPDFRQWRTADSSKVQDMTVLNNEVASIIDRFDLGGVILFAENVKSTEQTRVLTHDLQLVAKNDKDGNLPLLITLDQEGGIVTRLGTGTNLPGNMAIGATRNDNAAYDAGYVIGRELNSLGINVDFAPVLDVNNNPSNPVIGLRSISSNPNLVARLGVKMIEGISNQNVATAAKHFPGHGDTSTDSHVGLPSVDKSLEELKVNELVPFQAAIDNGVDMIMTAHIQYPQIEKDKYVSIKDGQEVYIPSTLSDDVITGLLRENMGYDGVVITDAMNMKAITENFGELEATKMAINAGVDIVLMPTILRSMDDVSKLEDIISGIKESIESGEISIDTINDSVKRIVKLKNDRGILDKNLYEGDISDKVEIANNIVGSSENRAIERNISSQAVTVLKNDGILPLEVDKNDNILLIAPYENELPGMKFGVNRLMLENRIKNVNMTTHFYKNENSVSKELSDKINNADHIILLTEISNNSHMNENHWLRKLPTDVINHTKEINKKIITASIGKPYDASIYDSNAQLIVYGYKGMDPTESDGGLSPEKAFGPNIPAAMDVIFGAYKADGTLPVDLPLINNDGSMDIGNNAYNFGDGITDIKDISIEKVSGLDYEKTSTSIDLKWKNPKDDFGVKNYIIYKDGKEVARVPFGINSYKIDGLKENTIYSFKVTAQYSNGKESKPVSKNIRTNK